MYAILAENDSSATRFAIFLLSFIFAIGSVGTNYVANLIPFVLTPLASRSNI